MRFATAVTPRLMWFNLAHLFSVSLLPLSTAWMAVSELAAQPVAFYAAVFFLVNLTYILLILELIVGPVSMVDQGEVVVHFGLTDYLAATIIWSLGSPAGSRPA